MSNWIDSALNHKLKIVFSFFWLVLFWAGLSLYAGSKLVYVLFSVVSLMLLLSGIYRRVGYGYLFMVVFLWLGFWFKLTANFLLFRFFPFGEPVGNFNSSADAWDQVLFVSMCSFLGVMLGRFLFGLFHSKSIENTLQAKVPSWYKSIRIWLWTSVLFITVGMAIFNIFYGIHQVGMTPRTILSWPLNALVAWMLNLGSALLIAVLIWWDISIGKKITLQLYVILGEAFLSTVSVLSRSAFPFHAIPQLLALVDTKKIFNRYSRIKILIFIIIFLAMLLVSVASVSLLRDFYYGNSKSTPTPAPQSVARSGNVATKLMPSTSATKATSSIPSFRLILIHQLLVNRWIGIEGVMAVSSYEEKNRILLWNMLTEKREAGKVSAYQKISNSGYQTSDPRYQFASLPGVTAFFYYSGSLKVVVLGMMTLTLLILFAEKFIYALTHNPILCSLFGMTFANTAAQFGVTPRQDIPFFLLIFSSALIVCFLQSNVFSSILTRLSFNQFNKK